MRAFAVAAALLSASPVAAQTAVETAHLIVTGSATGAQAGPDRWVNDYTYPCLADASKTCRNRIETMQVDACRYRTVSDLEEGHLTEEVDLGKAVSTSRTVYGMDDDILRWTLQGGPGLICTTSTIPDDTPHECSGKIEHAGLKAPQVETLERAYAYMRQTFCHGRAF